MDPSGSEITLRLARETDAGDLARLSGQLGFPITPETAKSRLREALGSPDHALIVAEVAGGAAGLVELRRVRLATAWRQVEVIALVVDDAYRRRGIGTRLLAEAERWAYDLRCGKIRVRSNAERDHAHSLYRRSGFEPARAETLFEKQVGPVRPKTATFVPTSIASRRAPSTDRASAALATARLAAGALLIVDGGLRLESGISSPGPLSADYATLGAWLPWASAAVEVVVGAVLAAGRLVGQVRRARVARR